MLEKVSETQVGIKPLMMKDDEHGLPQVQPGEITPESPGKQQQQSPEQVLAGRRMWAPIAQTVEHLMRNQEVVGLMPTWVSLTFSSTV